MKIRSRAWIMSLLLASSCTTWVPYRVHPDSITSSEAIPGRVRVFRTDHSVLTLKNVEVSQDSLIGIADDPSHERIATPMDDVATVQARGLSETRTAWLTAIIAMYSLAAIAFYCTSCGGSK
jgi:hypothetical protein